MTNESKVIGLPGNAEQFSKRVLHILQKSGVPYLIGGSIAMLNYMHLPRQPKDLNVFLRRADCDKILSVLAENGLPTFC